MKIDDITQEMVRSRLLYVPALGCFVWLPRPESDFADRIRAGVWRTRYAGQIAGTIGNDGYRKIKIFGNVLKASRLTWIYHHGYWPECIDHIDGDRADDHIENLRNVSQGVNLRNICLDHRNRTGTPGVLIENGKYRVQICVSRRSIHLGYFTDLTAAIAARKAAEARFGFHPNHGRKAA